MKYDIIQNAAASLQRSSEENQGRRGVHEMTEYLTSSVTPTLGNENEHILQGEKENLRELWK